MSMKQRVEDALRQGEDLARQKRYEEALLLYEEALLLDPQNASVYKAQGLAFVRLERYQEALDAFEHALRLDAGQAEVHSDRGLVLRGLSNMKRRQGPVSEPSKSTPGTLTSLMRKGYCCRNLGGWRKP